MPTHNPLKDNLANMAESIMKGNSSEIQEEQLLEASNKKVYKAVTKAIQAMPAMSDVKDVELKKKIFDITNMLLDIRIAAEKSDV